MERYTNTILNKQGKPVVGAVVTVTTYPNNEPAVIYAADGGQPVEFITSDENGRFAFYAADGHYNLSIVGKHIDTITITDVVLNDPNGEASLAALAAAGGAALVGFQAAPGAAARTLQEKARERVSAADYFVAGEADATGMIQRAINALGAAGGGIVELGRGVFETAGLTCLHSNVTIAGQGRGATILSYKGNSAACITFGQAPSGTGLITTVSNVGVRNLSINGNKALGATGAGIRTTQVDGCLFENVHVYDTGASYGFAIVGSGLTPRNDLVIRNCRASRCGADGLDIKADFSRILIDGFVTHDHDPNPPEEGDSVGLDIRGQYVTAMNVWAWGCPEIGIRVRVNAGDSAQGDAFVSLANCFSFNNNDGFDLSGPATCGIGAANIHGVRNARYGMTADGGGHVQATGSSFSKNLTGIRQQLGSCTVHLSSCQVNGNSSDAVISLSSGDFRATNSSIEGNGRYGVNISAKPAGIVELSNTSIKGNVTGIYGTATTACDVRLLGGQIVNQSSRGIDIIATSAAVVSAIGTRISGNAAANVYAVPAGALFLRCPGYVTRYKGKVSLAVDSTGVKTLTFTHGLAKTPAIEDCLLSLARATNVNDYAITFARVVGTSATTVSAQVNVSAASATAAATADVICSVDIA